MGDGVTEPRAQRPGHPHRDRWILLDSRMQLVVVGDELQQGTSARRLDPTARDLLLPRAREVLRTARPLVGAAHHSGRRWQIEVRPVIGAGTGGVLGVQAIYGHRDLPPRPLVGGWEWRVPAPDSGETVRAYWSPEVFALYGIPQMRSCWEGARFLDEVLSGSCRVRMRELLAKALRAGPDLHVIEEFSARNHTSGAVMSLRMAGRAEPAGPDGVRWIRGLTHFAPRSRHAGGEQPDLLAAVFADPEAALGVIDPAYRQIWMTSANFGRLLGVRLPSTRSLADVCHAEDAPALQDLIERVPRCGAGTLHRVRFTAPHGSWRALEVSVTPTRIGGEIHVLGRFTPLPC
ncbi:PAS domain-containing protein [Amycolatopsis thermoflava]|uniref:PAS domain-containing protein n=1 Tax=Amycolatopsis thermoflava TaxID=84480 RepID=UPI0037FCCB9D